MDNHEWPFDISQYKLKTARQKKRLQKKDLDKQVIQLFRKRERLFKQELALPWIPLETPYQKGWKRIFVLREDLKRAPTADFYEELLKNINTVQHSQDKLFKARKKRKYRKSYVEQKQLLREFQLWQWHGNKYHSLTEMAKAHFSLYEKWDEQNKTAEMVYRFNEPWRYVLKVVPHMITEVKMVDEQLQSDIRLLNNFIEKHNLDAHMYKLTGGAYKYWKSFVYTDKPRHIDLKKQALLEMNSAIAFNREQQF